MMAVLIMVVVAWLGLEGFLNILLLLFDCLVSEVGVVVLEMVVVEIIGF